MDIALDKAAPYFVASVEDFRRNARESGWTFFRGVLVGFVAAFPIAYAAAAGASLPGVG